MSLDEEIEPDQPEIDDKTKDDYLDMYDSDKWPNWDDFLKWLLGLLGKLFHIIFG